MDLTSLLAIGMETAFRLWLCTWLFLPRVQSQGSLGQLALSLCYRWRSAGSFHVVFLHRGHKQGKDGHMVGVYCTSWLKWHKKNRQEEEQEERGGWRVSTSVPFPPTTNCHWGLMQSINSSVCLHTSKRYIFLIHLLFQAKFIHRALMLCIQDTELAGGCPCFHSTCHPYK